VHETSEDGAPWNSFWWRERLNPAGLGITGNSAENNASRTWTNGRDAAISHVAHLYLYAIGDLRDAPTRSRPTSTHGTTPSSTPSLQASRGRSPP
jgi:hypothetical protein